MAEYIAKSVAIARLTALEIGNPCATMADAKRTIADTRPAADVAPVVHSYWEHKITDDGENIGICHNCKYPVSWFWEQARYCLNCGAKMDESMPKDGAD